MYYFFQLHKIYFEGNGQFKRNAKKFGLLFNLFPIFDQLSFMMTFYGSRIS